MNFRASLARKTQACVAAATLAMAAAPAYAQVLQPVVNATNLITNTVTGVTLAIMTIAFCIAGYKMAFQGANFSSVSNLVMGGAVSGGAAAIAALF